MTMVFKAALRTPRISFIVFLPQINNTQSNLKEMTHKQLSNSIHSRPNQSNFLKDQSIILKFYLHIRLSRP